MPESGPRSSARRRGPDEAPRTSKQTENRDRPFPSERRFFIMTKTSLQWASPLSIGLVAGAAVAAFLICAVLRKLAGAPIAPSRRWGLRAIRVLILGVLAVILLNPIRVEETPGAVERAKVVYLVDSSQSMALGEPGHTRWDQVAKTIRSAEEKRDSRTGPEVGVFRFGGGLAAVESPFWKRPETSPMPRGGAGSAVAAEVRGQSEPPPTPTDADTVLGAPLESLADRFGTVPPRAVVVFSDGRARDQGRAEAIARGYHRMKVPISVVPVGDEKVGGDVAIVSMVVPAQVRKLSQVGVSVFVRSYGYKGRRADLTLAAEGPDGKPGAVLARTPVTLQDGLANYSLTYPSGEIDRKLVASIPLQEGEVSADNNTFASEVAIDHTKIRILYVEGSAERFVARRGGFLGFGGTQEVQSAYTALQQALMEDPDIECTAVTPSSEGDFSVWNRADERGRGLPETPSELFAYDAIILSNVPREALSDPHLAWIDDWIARRGGGLMLVGGPNSFASGRWAGTTVGNMLPLEVNSGGNDWEGTLTALTPVESGPLHPVWHIAADDSENRALIKTLPQFLGHNRAGRAKPTAEVLARTGPGPADPPAFAAQPYGRGRTMAMTVGITRRFSPEFLTSWGGADARYGRKFWRNVAYWLTENSSIGRRRLLAETDKRLYRPGEPIVLTSRAFDENASPTLDYRVSVSVEPKAATDNGSDNSPLRRPTIGPTPTEASGPLLPWGEEFDLAKVAGESSYATSLPIADAKSLPAGVSLTQSLRIELTAYEGNTQVDSTAIDVQILDDPGEQQNPLPDHDLLARVAEASGGSVLKDPDDLTTMLKGLPVTVGMPEVKTMPAWSRGWLMTLLIGLLTVEWVWRRRVGLA